MFFEVTCESKIICKKAKEADSFVDRLIGLMFVKKMNNYDGLLITGCNSIHTFFMRYSLDVVFLDEKNIIRRIYRNIVPCRMTRFVWGATKVLEVEAGKLPSECEVGKKMEITCIN